jgi:hypothetical protein
LYLLREDTPWHVLCGERRFDLTHIHLTIFGGVTSKRIQGRRLPSARVE